MKTRATLVDVRFVINCTYNEIYFTNRKLLVAKSDDRKYEYYSQKAVVTIWTIQNLDKMPLI